ncbi:hypothetical protein HN832_04465 [archaeon]|jgi:hypothetical protein|nr:hypothetical protein [archaeon]MBT4373353.1 hypothetical protein [archaeon]MBT4531801.1 hypothetical protein [archaeon]MBT7001468.1 hypothetical protein [archaeon]MBT7282640.1 hypothetical protein [archaeon]
MVKQTSSVESGSARRIREILTDLNIKEEAGICLDHDGCGYRDNCNGTGLITSKRGTSNGRIPKSSSNICSDYNPE